MLLFQYVEINYADINNADQTHDLDLHKRNVAVFIIGVDSEEELDAVTRLMRTASSQTIRFDQRVIATQVDETGRNKNRSCPVFFL
jgi:hypothetical protein